MALLSLILGLISIPFLFLGIIPCFGWLNWLSTLPLAGIGLMIAIFKYLNPENRHNTILRLSLIINTLIIFISIVRLLLGGGFF